MEEENNPFVIFKNWYEEAIQKLDYEYAVSAALATVRFRWLPRCSNGSC
jgi:pyridoxine/pyridoxamine 5'-phosphate oxidase